MDTIHPRVLRRINEFRELPNRKGERKYWFDDNVKQIEQRLVQRRWFKEVHRDLTREDVGILSSRLQFLSFWYARQGLVAVWEGEIDEGWHAIQRALLYRYWDARLFRKLRPNGAADIFQLSDHAHAFCHALVTGQEAEARWLGNDLCDQAKPGHQTNFEPGRVENFAVWLYGQWTHDPSCITGKPLGAYQSLVDAWTTGGETLTQAVKLFLDWRLKHTNEDDPNDEKIEWGYDTQPYDFWPVEILAMERVRREHGLPSIPWPTHALLDTPLWRHPPPVGQPLPADPLVDRVVAAVRKLYPDL